MTPNAALKSTIDHGARSITRQADDEYAMRTIIVRGPKSRLGEMRAPGGAPSAFNGRFPVCAMGKDPYRDATELSNEVLEPWLRLMMGCRSFSIG